MNLMCDAIAGWMAAAGWLVLVPMLALAWRAARRDFLPHGLAQHAWLGGAVTLAMLWKLQVAAGGAPAFGMIGAALYALIFGYARAVLGLLAALLLHTALYDGSWINVGINGLLLAVVPAALVTALRLLVQRWLPADPFVYMIGNGLFGTLAATLLARAAIIAVSLLAWPFRATVSFEDYVLATLLMAWSEAIVSGMVLSALVVFVPQVVLTFSADLYERGRA